jgi:DNA-binding transcriptional LysR family regulator
MINLNQLRAFYQAAKGQSYSQAARDLFVSQPAVNAQVKLFEETCGLRLLVTKGRRLQLTEEGKVVYEAARKIFEAEKKIEAALEELRQLSQGTLRLGTARTYARYFMPLLVSLFRQAHPQIQILLSEGSSQDMLRSLHELGNQLVVVSQAAADSRISFLPFCQEEVVLLLYPGHPLAHQRSVAVADLTGETIIMKETGSGTRGLVDRLLAEQGVSPRILMETSDAEMIKLLVQHGEGISFLVRVAAAAEIKEKKLVTVPLKGARTYLDVGVAYRRDHPRSPSARAFLETLKGLTKSEGTLQSLSDLNRLIRV